MRNVMKSGAATSSPGLQYFFMRLNIAHKVVDYDKHDQAAVRQMIKDLVQKEGDGVHGIPLADLDMSKLTAHSTALEKVCRNFIDSNAAKLQQLVKTFTAEEPGKYCELVASNDKVESAKRSLDESIAQIDETQKDIALHQMQHKQNAAESKTLADTIEIKADSLETSKETLQLLLKEMEGLQDIDVRVDYANKSAHGGYEFESIIGLSPKENGSKVILVLDDETDHEEAALRRYIDDENSLIPSDIAMLANFRNPSVLYNSINNDQSPELKFVSAWNKEAHELTLSINHRKAFTVLLYTVHESTRDSGRLKQIVNDFNQKIVEYQSEIDRAVARKEKREKYMVEDLEAISRQEENLDSWKGKREARVHALDDARGNLELQYKQMEDAASVMRSKVCDLVCSGLHSEGTDADLAKVEEIGIIFDKTHNFDTRIPEELSKYKRSVNSFLLQLAEAQSKRAKLVKQTLGSDEMGEKVL